MPQERGGGTERQRKEEEKEHQQSRRFTFDKHSTPQALFEKIGFFLENLISCWDSQIRCHWFRGEAS
jgi:hypothetical protein